jgi:transcriptional regulator with XRE-family HTH domain
MVSVRQVEAARALLGWSQGALAEASGVPESIVARLEAQDGEIDGRDGGAKLLAALEAAGVVFLPENGEGQGVRLRKPLSSIPSSIPLEDLNAENDE